MSLTLPKEYWEPREFKIRDYHSWGDEYLPDADDIAITVKLTSEEPFAASWIENAFHHRDSIKLIIIDEDVEGNHTCQWCGRLYEGGESNCHKCGGPRAWPEDE